LSGVGSLNKTSTRTRH